MPPRSPLSRSSTGRRPAVAAALALAAAPAPARAAPALAPVWAALPAGLPADSLAPALHALEVRSGPGPGAAPVAFALGQLHYARGEYRQAADAFGRAAARLGGADRDEASYWTGLALLGAGAWTPARGVLADLAAGAGPRRADAQLALACALESGGDPAGALQVLERLLAAGAGDAAPAALERYATLAARFHRDADARRARERLGRDYPASLEAARLATAAAPVPPPGAGAVRVQIGAFADPARAQTLAAEARRAGFPAARAALRPAAPGRPELWIVDVGAYATPGLARAAGARAERALGVAWRVEAP